MLSNNILSLFSIQSKDIHQSKQCTISEYISHTPLLHPFQILPSAHPIAGFELAPIAFTGDDVECFAASVVSYLFRQRRGRFADFQHITGDCVCRTLVGGIRRRNGCAGAVRQANPAVHTDASPIL